MFVCVLMCLCLCEVSCIAIRKADTSSIVSVGMTAEAAADLHLFMDLAKDVRQERQ